MEIGEDCTASLHRPVPRWSKGVGARGEFGASGGVDEGAVYVRLRAMHAETWSETWSARVRRVVADGRAHAHGAHGAGSVDRVQGVGGARDGTDGRGAGQDGITVGGERALHAVSMGMCWVESHAPADCVAPALELQEDVKQQQLVQHEHEHEADGSDPRQSIAAAHLRTLHSVRTVSSMAMPCGTQADARARDAWESAVERREQARGAAGAAGARGVQQHAGHSRCSVEPENFLFTEFTRSSQTPAKPPFVAARSRELPRGLDDRRAVTGHSEAGEGARGGDGHRGLSARVQAAVGGMREGAKRASEWARRWYYRDAG